VDEDHDGPFFVRVMRGCPDAHRQAIFTLRARGEAWREVPAAGTKLSGINGCGLWLGDSRSSPAKEVQRREFREMRSPHCLGCECCRSRDHG
jgi:hypothetical protein